MLPCPACDRHIATNESACPFCGASQRSVAVYPKLALVAGVALAGCGPVVADGGGSSGADDGSSTSTVGTSTSTSTTTGGTTSTSTGSSSGDASTDAPGSSSGPIDESTSSSTTDVDDSFDTCAGFYGGCPSDFEASPYECDVWMDDCGDDEKCAPWANDGGVVWNATKCVPIGLDEDATGETCTVEGSGYSGIDSCAPGNFCFDVDPKTNDGTCVALCTGSAEEPVCGTGECAMFDPLVLNLCLELCDPEGDECAVEETCEELVEGFEFHTCVPPETKK